MNPEVEDAAIILWRHIENSLEGIAALKPDGQRDSFVTSHATQEQCRNVLRRVFQDPNIVFPFIAPDGEGGIAVVWHAAKHSLQIVIGSDAEVTVIATSPSIPLVMAELEEFGLTRLQTFIYELSELVKARNPQWRQLFGERA